IYAVLFWGVAMGFEMETSDKPSAGDQEKEETPLAHNGTLAPGQTMVSAEASKSGLSTLTRIASVSMLSDVKEISSRAKSLPGISVFASEMVMMAFPFAPEFQTVLYCIQLQAEVEAG